MPCWLHGRLLDGEASPSPDGIIETWQADPDGRFDHPDDPRGPVAPTVPWLRPQLHRRGRHAGTCSPSSRDPCPAEEGSTEAPHVDVSVFARGLLHRLVTRIYFDDEADLNAADPTLSAVDPARRPTLVARRDDRGYRIDFRLQGDGETVFFDV